MSLLPIGYPLGFLPTGEYKVERFNESNVNLTGDELVLWAQVFSSNEIEADSFKTLIEKGVVIEFGNNNDFFSLLKNVNAMRLGGGWFADGKYCVEKEKEFYFLTELQHKIWLDSDGKITVEELFNNIGAEQKGKKEKFENDFCYSIIYLVKNELLLLR